MIIYKYSGRGHAVWTLASTTCALPRTLKPKNYLSDVISAYSPKCFKSPYFQKYVKKYILTYLVLKYFTNLILKTNYSYKVQLYDGS